MDGTTNNFRIMRVARWQNITPHMRRITLTGTSLQHLDSSGMHARLLFPSEEAREWPTPTADGRLRWRPGQAKMASRAYTIRNLRTDIGEIDIDFVLHGDEGIASRWAAHLKEGDEIGVMGPIGRAIPAADWYVLVGDETALSPIGRILEHLPSDAKGLALIEVADEGEKQHLQAPAGITIRWLYRNGEVTGRSPLLKEEALAEGIPSNAKVFCWLGAERSTFQQVRDFWRDRCKLGMSQTLAVPYWRYGSEQFRDQPEIDVAKLPFADPFDADKLSEIWQAYRLTTPETDARAFAAAQGVSEADIIALGLGSGSQRLNNDWEGIINGLPDIGPVIVETCCGSAVHEKSGTFSRIMWDDERPVVLDHNINLRIRLENWVHGFATSAGTERSIQVLDCFGASVFKVKLAQGADVGAFDELVATHKGADQSRNLGLRKRPAPTAERDDASIDSAGLLSDWRSMLDTHDIFALARRYGASRVQAFRLVPDSLARRVDKGAFARLVEEIVSAREEVMVFVSSPGNVQIHIGPLDRCERTGTQFRVTGPDFRLHLREAEIDSCWIINKPTVDGDVTSLEIFDANGDQIAWIFGKRKPGERQSPTWRPLVEKSLEMEPA